MLVPVGRRQRQRWNGSIEEMVCCAVVLWDGQVVRDGVDVVGARHAHSAYALASRSPPQRALAVHGHVVPGQSHHAESRELEIGVAVGVALAVAPGAVELEAVELDGESLFRPEGVNFVGACLSLNCSIEEWVRYVRGGFEELLEAAFELALLGARLVGGDRPPQRPLRRGGRWRARGRR